MLTDEIYDEIWYRPGHVPSMAGVEPRLTDGVFLTNGVSKTYAMTAATAALTGDQSFVRDCVSVYRGRRDEVVKRINDTPGLFCTPPSGGFYAFVNCAGVIGRRTPSGDEIRDDEDFAAHLLESRRVAVIHGAAYGAPGYFRISFATSHDLLTAACEGIARACADLS
ncbi:aminotransferase class I/II-fold pyridoxal phosphate-dependent enzyme [Streptomyces javensis]|uniref:Aminotransferase class I/classII large domain-containing protein n=1 Tax=Streptomyces javensis TaxID=114698 RepID=A0ABN1WLM9_9ACTN